MKSAVTTRILALTPFSPLALTAQPVIATTGVVGAALSSPPVIKLAPLSIVAVFGQDFAPASTAAISGSANLVNRSLPTNLANTCATFSGVPAPLFAVFPGQINLQVPALSGTAAALQVTSGCGTAQASLSNTVTVDITPTSPQFFYFSAGTSNSIAAVNQSGADVGPAGLLNGVTFVSVNPGDYAVLFATGLGATQTPQEPGEHQTGTFRLHRTSPFRAVAGFD